MRRLIECVPNFSEGRDPARIDALVATMSGVAGAAILDRQSDFDHHRSVITLAGTPEAVAEAALRGVGKAAELIDLTRHAGVHPRIGATDVLPFVPIEGVTMEECAELAHHVGREIWERYRIPVYFYENAATRTGHRNLEDIRRGQFEGLRDAAPGNPDRAPDIGGPALHPTAGAVAVGARKVLIAYNILLSTPDASIAKEIARAIRFSSGGLRHVKAIGLELKTRGRAQVSINLTDFEATPLHRVFEMVRRETERHGCMIVGSEIVGLAPQGALDMTAAYFLRLEATAPVLEQRLAAALDAQTVTGISLRTQLSDICDKRRLRAARRQDSEVQEECMTNRRTFGAAIIVGILAGVLSPLARAGALPTDVIAMFPQSAGEFAYADLRQARGLSWFPQLQDQMLPARFRDFERFLASAGIDPNVQVEELAWALVPKGLPSGAAANTGVPTSEDVVGIALGAFRPESAEAYFRAKKLPVTKVRTFSLYAFGGGSGEGDLFFTFIDSNTAAFGQRAQLEKLIAVRYGEEPGLMANKELSSLVTQANGSGVVWAVLSAAYTRLAMGQLTPEISQFPQAQQLIGKLRAMTIEITAAKGVQAHFQAVCATPDDANTFAALLEAGLLYRRYQIGTSNPDLATLLDEVRVAPSGDRLDIRLSLTDDQMVALIRRNTFAIKM